MFTLDHVMVSVLLKLVMWVVCVDVTLKKNWDPSAEDNSRVASIKSTVTFAFIVVSWTWRDFIMGLR